MAKLATRPTVGKRGWIDALRALDVADVAVALGLTIGKAGSAVWISPCPACHAPRRHTKRGDTRGAVGLTHDGRGWRCHQCDAGGDGLQFLAYAVAGEGLGKGDPRWREVRQLAEDFGLMGPQNRAGTGGGPARPVRAEGAPGGGEDGREARRPPAGEVAALWAACGPVAGDAAVRRWIRGDVNAGLKARPGIRLELVDLLDLARVLPSSGELPRWARFQRRTWLEAGYRLVVPLYDARGALVSLRARPLDGRKGLLPAGHAAGGLVCADFLGREMLRSPNVADQVRRAGVVIVEGEADFLGVATRYSDGDESAPAVFATGSGWWCREHADRVPDGTAVTIATDGDQAGNGYAEKIAATFAGRDVTLQRTRTPGD